MNFVFIAALAGLLLIYFEFFLPGAIMAIGGACLIFSSLVLFIMQGFGLGAILAYGGILLILTLAICKLALWRLKAGRAKNDFLLGQDQEGFQASAFDQSAVGKRGQCLSDLKPAGHIVIEGKSCQALSQFGYLEKGVQIEVVGGRGAYLIVMEKKL